MTTQDEIDSSPEKRGRIDRIKQSLASAVSYVMPLLMSSPGLYAGIMTTPFLSYLVLMFMGQGGVFYLFLGGSIFENIMLILGIVFFLYSVLFLWRTKSEGLVKTGPYRVVRHPQYLSLILFTAVLTSRSVWVLLNTFGVGFLSPYETIAVWFVMDSAYIGLALFEEHHLSGVYADAWADYHNHVGFLIPLIRSKRKWLETLISILFMIILMVILLFSNSTLQWFF